jgi:hypothetical protein
MHFSAIDDSDRARVFTALFSARAAQRPRPHPPLWQGHHVALQGQVDAGKNEVQVVSLEMAKNSM